MRVSVTVINLTSIFIYKQWLHALTIISELAYRNHTLGTSRCLIDIRCADDPCMVTLILSDTCVHVRFVNYTIKSAHDLICTLFTEVLWYNGLLQFKLPVFSGMLVSTVCTVTCILAPRRVKGEKSPGILIDSIISDALVIVIIP